MGWTDHAKPLKESGGGAPAGSTGPGQGVKLPEAENFMVLVYP